MKTFWKIGFALLLLCFCMHDIKAKTDSIMKPAFPIVWHQPDTVINYPMLCDTIPMPGAYTMMMVYKSLHPDTTQQLWKLSRTDKKYQAVETHAWTTDKSIMRLRPARSISTPCIYTLQHTIKSDTSYHDSTFLHIGSDSEGDTSHITLYEAAYFNNRLSLTSALMFQTYLALKHGITLDGVSYISTTGDTLWDAKLNREFYHHIQGIGTNLEYSFTSLRSVSLEDTTICIFSHDTLPPDNYLVMGDNNAELSWQTYDNNIAQLSRIWKLRVTGSYDTSIHLRVCSQPFQMEKTDSLFLTRLDSDYNIIQHIRPDSVVNNIWHYFTLLPYDEMYLSLGMYINNPSSVSHARINRQTKTNPEATLSDYVEITPNPTDGNFTAFIHLKESTTVTLRIQDMAGKTIRYIVLPNIQDFQYNDKINTAGMYIVTFANSQQDIIDTKELIVY